MRLIFDQGEGNRLWRTPPWAALGGVSALSWLDFTGASEGKKEFRVATGDVPNFYYNLEFPVWLSPWFVFEGVKVKDLAVVGGEIILFKILDETFPPTLVSTEIKRSRKIGWKDSPTILILLVFLIKPQAQLGQNNVA